MVIGAAALMLVGRHVRAPSIVVYILTGLLLGPVAGVLEVSESLHLIGEVGIALLLFVVGLELSLDKIRDVGKVAVQAGLVQIGASVAAGFGLCRLLGFPTVEALLLATALAFSSTVVVVKLLDQKKELHDLHGRISIGVLLIQDVVVILVLTFIAGIGRQGELGASTLLRGMGAAFGGMALLLGVALLASRHLLPKLFRWIARASDAMFIWSLFWCFLFVLFAEALHLSPEIGAFLAGISLAQLPYAHSLRRRVHPLMNFFIAVFFVSLGAEMELEAASSAWGSALILALFVLASKMVVLTLVLARLGYPIRTAFLAGITLAQISEFSFILMALAAEAGLAGESSLGLVALVGLGTIAVSSYLILGGSRLYALAQRSGLLGRRRDIAVEPADHDEALTGHVIVVGMNALGRSLVGHLVERGERVLAIDTDPDKMRGLPCLSLVGSAEDLSLLEEANLAHARLLVSALQIEDTNYLLAFRARQFGVPSSIHAFDQSLVDELRRIGVGHLLMSKNLGIQRLARELQEQGVLRA